MKLIRFGEAGKEKPGVMINDNCYDVSAWFEDFDEQFFENGGLARLEQVISKNKLTVAEVKRFGCPIKKPSKIVCIGLNYRDHAKETNATLPAEPVIFMKSTTSVVGPNDDIIIPRDSKKTDWEVEIAFVVGRKASYVDEVDAMDYVAGYVLHNDVSEREFQLERGGTWDKGKGCDTFAPVGPFLATKEEIADVDNLHMWLSVNGQTKQDSSTENLVFKIPFLLSYISRFMTLLPGDIISTGTPAGVALGMKPPVYLKPGDVIELGIDGLGKARQNVIAYR